MKHSILLLLAGAAAPAVALADICRWKDANGQIHFGEAAPRGVQCENVRMAPAPDVSPNQEQLSNFVKDAEKQAADDRQKAEALAKEKAEKQKNCEASQAQLATLEGRSYYNRIGKKDDKGNWAELNEEEYQQRLKNERERNARNCS